MRDVFNHDALKKDMVTRNPVDFPQIDTRSPLHHSKQMHLAPSKVHHPMAGWAASLRCLLACLWLGLPTALSAQSHHWRGPHQNGFFPDGSLSGQLDASSMNWKVALPGKGTSTPVVTKDWIVLTYAHEGQNTVAAYRRNGEPGWIALCGAEAPGKHRNGSGSNASIATDGDHFFAYFKSGHWVGLDHQGHTLWKHHLVEQYGPVSLYWDHGTSPLITSHGVVMARMHEGESWLASYAKETGALQWKQSRNFSTPTEGDHGYSSPIIAQLEGQEVILVWGAQHLTCHDIKTGKTVWSCGDFNPKKVAFWPAVASPIQAGETVVVPFGRADKKQPRLHGILLEGTGDVTKTHRRWNTSQYSSFVPSLTFDGALAICLSDRGTLAGIQPDTGQTAWVMELPKHRSSYYASPSVVGDKLIAAREDGAVFVLQLGEKPQLIGGKELGERVIASPVFDGTQLLIRSEKHLISYR